VGGAIVIAFFIAVLAFNYPEKSQPFKNVEDAVMPIQAGEALYIGFARQAELDDFQGGAKIKIFKGLGTEMISPQSLKTESRSISLSSLQIVDDVEIRLDNAFRRKVAKSTSKRIKLSVNTLLEAESSKLTKESVWQSTTRDNVEVSYMPIAAYPKGILHIVCLRASSVENIEKVACGMDSYVSPKLFSINAVRWIMNIF
jgi:hypothetical protein